MNKKGFTLVELVIVIIIVGILSIVSVPIYRGYVEKAMLTEGKTLIGSIGRAEIAYHVENEEFITIARTSYNTDLDVDARGGKYFREFACPDKGKGGSHPTNDSSSASFSSSVNKADGGTIDDEFADHWVTIEVYGSNNTRSWVLRTRQWGDGYMEDVVVSES